MAIRKIVFEGDPCLRTPTPEMAHDDINNELRVLMEDMFDTMYDAPGCGLAAPQIGISKRIAVIDVSSEKNQRYYLINPEIIEHRGSEMMEEGCLSVPGVSEKVKRSTWVKMRALDQYGKPYELEAEGILAECIQHEIDHLNGKLYIDLLSSLKRNRLLKRYKKLNQ